MGPAGAFRRGPSSCYPGKPRRRSFGDPSARPRGQHRVVFRNVAGAISSAGERSAHTGKVTGSIPVSPTTNWPTHARGLRLPGSAVLFSGVQPQARPAGLRPPAPLRGSPPRGPSRLASPGCSLRPGSSPRDPCARSCLSHARPSHRSMPFSPARLPHPTQPLSPAQSSQPSSRLIRPPPLTKSSHSIRPALQPSSRPARLALALNPGIPSGHPHLTQPPTSLAYPSITYPAFSLAQPSHPPAASLVGRLTRPGRSVLGLLRLGRVALWPSAHGVAGRNFWFACEGASWRVARGS